MAKKPEVVTPVQLPNASRLDIALSNNLVSVSITVSTTTKE